MSNTVLPSLAEKPSYVRRMFAGIAPRYDLMNRLMTFGLDRVWRRSVVRLCALPRGGRLLDVATGTGEIAYEALRADPSAQVVGLDLTREMMLYARRRVARLQGFPPASPGRGGAKTLRVCSVSFTEGDALALPFPDDSFDAACSGFMMRNVTDIRAAFAEQVRVVRPGGRVVCLEITRPAQPVLRALFDLYLFGFVPFIGGLISGHRDAYTYLPHSTLPFPRPPELARIMESVGLRDVRYQTAMLGTVALHWGTK